MNRNTKNFFATFAITLILLGAVCGFAAVDLSTGRYMPDSFGHFFEVRSVKADRIEFTLMAQSYVIETPDAVTAAGAARKYAGLIPALPRVISSLAADATDTALKWIGANMTE